MSTDPQAAPRPLPDRPNLRHLKDQAKDLLKTGAAASITDAQFRVARQIAHQNHLVKTSSHNILLLPLFYSSSEVSRA